MVTTPKFLPAEKMLVRSKVEDAVRWLVRVALVAYALSWYDMLNIASGVSAYS